jgi:Fe-S oxidoreductase
VKAVNWASHNGPARALMEKTLGVAAEAALPPYAERRFRDEARPSVRWPVRDGQRTRGKVALFTTCYVNYNEPGIARDLVKVLAHNEVPYVLAARKPAAACPSSSSATSRRSRSSRT